MWTELNQADWELRLPMADTQLHRISAVLLPSLFVFLEWGASGICYFGLLSFLPFRHC